MNNTMLAFTLGSLFGTLITYILCRFARSSSAAFSNKLQELDARILSIEDTVHDTMAEGFEEVLDITQQTFAELYRMEAPLPPAPLQKKLNANTWRECFTKGLMHMLPHSHLQEVPSMRNFDEMLRWTAAAIAHSSPQKQNVIAASELMLRAKDLHAEAGLDAARIYLYKALLHLLEFGPEIDELEPGAEQVQAVRDAAARRAQEASKDAHRWHELQRYDAGLFHVRASLDLLQIQTK